MASQIPEKTAMFRGRLAKNARHFRKWAARAATTAYRVYDSDIPEVPLQVEIYGTDAVLADRRSFLEGAAGEDEWLDAMVAVATEVLGVAPFVRRRERKAHHDGTQYERAEEAEEWRQVTEGAAKFWVNLDGYLDTGLFLDHRITRELVAADARGKRFLNLFSYTGAFTVQAALAGATESVSVDMSRTYTEWAQRNLNDNCVSSAHQIVCSDVMAYLAAFGRVRFDVAIVDPPTFSNSKKMRSEWDVQRDHEQLLARVARIMTPGGILWFSTNSRRFRLGQVPGEVEDMSAATLPEDFRDAKVHKAWRIVLPGRDSPRV